MYHHRRANPFAYLIPVLIALYAIGQVITFYACAVDGGIARRVLREEGYTEIVLGTYAWTGCPKDDLFRRQFHAQHGLSVVDGVICCAGTAWDLTCDVRH